MWTIKKLAGTKHNISPTWKILMKDVDLGEPTSFLDHVYLGCTQRECMSNKQGNCRQLQKYVRIQDLCRRKRKVALFRKKNLKHTFPHGLHGPVTWKVMQRNAWRDIVSCRMTTTNSMKKNWDQLENCQNVCAQFF